MDDFSLTIFVKRRRAEKKDPLIPRIAHANGKRRRRRKRRLINIKGDFGGSRAEKRKRTMLYREGLEGQIIIRKEIRSTSKLK